MDYEGHCGCYNQVTVCSRVTFYLDVFVCAGGLRCGGLSEGRLLVLAPDDHGHSPPAVQLRRGGGGLDRGQRPPHLAPPAARHQAQLRRAGRGGTGRQVQ